MNMELPVWDDEVIGRIGRLLADYGDWRRIEGRGVHGVSTEGGD